MTKEITKKIDTAKVKKYLQEGFVEPEEIVTLFNEGQLTADEAIKIAQENGWEDQLLADPLFNPDPDKVNVDISDDWIDNTDFMNEADAIVNDFNDVPPPRAGILPEEGEMAEAKKVATNKKPSNFKTPTTSSGAATNKKPGRTGVNPQEPKQTSNVKKAGEQAECKNPKGLPNRPIAGVKAASEVEEGKKIGNPPKGLPSKSIPGVKGAGEMEESKKTAVAKQSKVAAKGKVDTKAKDNKKDFKKDAKKTAPKGKNKGLNEDLNPKIKALNESIERLQIKKSLMEELEIAKKQLSKLKQQAIKK